MNDYHPESISEFPSEQTDDLDAFEQIMKECKYKDYQNSKNYASYSTRDMGGFSDEIMDRFKRFNFVDQSLPSQAFGIETKCVDMLAELWNAPDPNDAYGFATTGSSEACILAGISFKQNWEKKKIQTGRPNLVISSECHVVWEKFANLFDIELRTVPISRKHLSLDTDCAISLCDENTIGLVAILGSSGLGLYDDVAGLSDKVELLNKTKGYDLGIHVDAASGGFYAPFINPDLVWDFRLKSVVSINVSGHKFGLVYPSVGWLLWKSKSNFPKKMSSSLNYIGGLVEYASLNFSKPMAQVIAQYYQINRLGKDGYAKIHNKSKRIATYLNAELKKMGCFDLLSDGSDLPVVCWTLKAGLKIDFDLYDLATRLENLGWFIPAYSLPSSLTDTVVQRVVVNSDITFDEARGIIRDTLKSIKVLSPKNKVLARSVRVLECV